MALDNVTKGCNVPTYGVPPAEQQYRCAGAHRFFVAEVVGVESEGTVHILALCTDCGETIHRSFAVSNRAATLTLKNTKD